MYYVTVQYSNTVQTALLLLYLIELLEAVQHHLSLSLFD